MPYLITTRWSDCDFPRDCGECDISRRAVATLEEAKRKAEIGLVEYKKRTGEMPPISAMDTTRKLPESGGTVGPLPDGTVIEVERVEWNRLSRLAESDTDDHAMIIDAYNAREGS